MKQYFRNTIDFHEMEGGIVPLRLTKQQMAFYEPTPWKFRSFNTAGVCLDFMTDSPTFRLKYRVKIKPGTTENLHFDIYVDDRLITFPTQEITTKGEGDWTVQLPIQPGQPRRVTIYFPVLARVLVDEMNVADGAVWEPVKPYERNLLCLGDSITQGLDAANPSSCYAALLSRFLGMNLLNQAMSGYYFNPDTIDPELDYKPDLITIAYGTNDWAMSESHEHFRTAASQYIGKLTQLYPEVPITVLSPLWRHDMHEEHNAGPFTSFHQTLEQICSQHKNVLYVNGFDLVPHHPAFFKDGLHPNNEGFLHMAMNIIKAMKQAGTI